MPSPRGTYLALLLVAVFVPLSIPPYRDALAGIFELIVTSLVLRREENKLKTLMSPYIYWLLGFLHVVKYDTACSQI